MLPGVGPHCVICGCCAPTQQGAEQLMHCSEHSATICSASARQGHLKNSKHSTRASPFQSTNSAAHMMLLDAQWQQVPGCRGLSERGDRGRPIASMPCRKIARKRMSPSDGLMFRLHLRIAQQQCRMERLLRHDNFVQLCLTQSANFVPAGSWGRSWPQSRRVPAMGQPSTTPLCTLSGAPACL